jgi:hypothetical protein
MESETFFPLVPKASQTFRLCINQGYDNPVKGNENTLNEKLLKE